MFFPVNTPFYCSFFYFLLLYSRSISASELHAFLMKTSLDCCSSFHYYNFNLLLVFWYSVGFKSGDILGHVIVFTFSLL
uniref:Uncharacterized protein n=1 Tax=Anabas testudineus TaxID=64144 RepID=A0A3Q1IJH7_ANATE